MNIWILLDLLSQYVIVNFHNCVQIKYTSLTLYLYYYYFFSDNLFHSINTEEHFCPYIRITD